MKPQWETITKSPMVSKRVEYCFANCCSLFDVVLTQAHGATNFPQICKTQRPFLFQLTREEIISQENPNCSPTKWLITTRGFEINNLQLFVLLAVGAGYTLPYTFIVKEMRCVFYLLNT